MANPKFKTNGNKFIKVSERSVVYVESVNKSMILNETGTYIYEMISNSGTIAVDTIINNVWNRYKSTTSFEQVESDVRKLIELWHSQSLIVPE